MSVSTVVYPDATPVVCRCEDWDLEIWFDTFGCDCTPRKLTKFIDLQVQRTLNTTGQGTLSFPIEQVGNLAEVWPDQTAVVVKVCGMVRFAGIVKEVGLDSGVVSLGLKTWDEWLTSRYPHENVLFGSAVVPQYDQDGNVMKDPGVDEVQRLCIDATGGQFALLVTDPATKDAKQPDVQRTALLDWDASATQIRTALEGTSYVEKGGVAVVPVDAVAGNRCFTITFTGPNGWVDEVPLTVDDDGLSAVGGRASTGTRTQGDANTDEVQWLWISANTTGGTFTLSYGGSTTDPIDFDATPKEVKKALEGIGPIDVGDIDVSGGSGPGTRYWIEFTHPGKRTAITVDDTNLVAIPGHAAIVTLVNGEPSTGVDLNCTVTGLDLTASEAIARLVTYAASPTPAHTTGGAVTLGDYGPDDRNGLYTTPFCVPRVQGVAQTPDARGLDYMALWCEGKSIADLINDIQAKTGVEYITDAIQDKNGCWTHRMIVSDRIGSKTAIPVYAPGSALTITPAAYNAVVVTAGKTCYPPNCPGHPRWPAGEKQWGGCYTTAFGKRAVRETLIDQGEAAPKGSPTAIGAALRAGACDRLSANTPRDGVTVSLVLGADKACQPGVDIGGVVRVDLGPEAGCYLGDMRVRADTFTANAGDGLQRELTLDPVTTTTDQFKTGCDSCDDC